MKDCRLVDELALPLKNFENFLEAATHASKCGLGHCLSHFFVLSLMIGLLSFT